VDGLEVDFIIPGPERRLTLIEARATATPVPAHVASVVRLRANIKNHRIATYVVHAASKSQSAWTAISPDIKAVPVHNFVDVLQ